MKDLYVFGFLCCILCLLSCQKEISTQEKETLLTNEDSLDSTSEAIDTISQVEIVKKEGEVNEDTISTIPDWQSWPDSALVDMRWLDNEILLDVRYASTNNFTGEVLYPCETCLLRKKVAQALKQVQDTLKTLGYQFLIFDCYRPHSVQVAMWGKFPDRRYVADPAKGSMHNRGGAIDLTLANLEGEALEMGSPFDHFGKESHLAYQNLAFEVLKRREFLQKIMANYGFGGINSEWWHFSYRRTQYRILDQPLPCEIKDEVF